MYLCIAQQLFIVSSLGLKAHTVLNLSDVVLQMDNFTVSPITFFTFYPKLTFLPQITFETSCVL